MTRVRILVFLWFLKFSFLFFKRIKWTLNIRNSSNKKNSPSKKFEFSISKIYISLDPKRTESRSEKIVHKVQFFTIHREKFPVHEYIYVYTYKKKNSPRTKNILSSFSFVLPLDIHSWKRSLFPRMQQIEYALRSAQIQRTTRGTNSTYTHSSHSMLTHRLTRRGKEGEREKSERGTHTTEYWFAFLHSVIVLTLLDRIARYVCTYNLCVQRQQIKIKPAKKREGRGRRGVGRMLLEENQSSSVRNRLSSEGDREYNKQRRSEEFKRAEAIASKSTHSCNNPLRNRCAPIYHFENISSRRGMVLPRKQQGKKTPLEFIRAMIDEPRLGMENTKFFSPRVFITREILHGCLSLRARRNV